MSDDRKVPRYSDVIVNGYDERGGLQFSRRVNCQQEFESAVVDAKETLSVTTVRATF